MKMKKWNVKIKRYGSYEPPVKDGHYTSYEKDMDAEVNCASCGKVLKYADCYTSREIFTDSKFWGMAVCEECYAEEAKRFYGKENY